MSNVIKAYTVYYDKSITKTIDSHENWKEKEMLARKSMPAVTDKTEGFVSGLDAVQVKELPSEEEQKEESGQLIENANSGAGKAGGAAVPERNL